MLLSYGISVHIISKLASIPFIGLAVTFLGFPIALKLSIKELFIIELIGFTFSFGIQLEYMLNFINIALSVIPNKLLFTVFLLIILPLFFAVFSLTSAFIMKLLSRFTPKRIKVILNES